MKAGRGRSATTHLLRMTGAPCMLATGVQDAPRPRTGLSPPERPPGIAPPRTSLLPDTADTGAPRRRSVMADRHLPVRPNLEQLRHQAKDLLRAARAGTPAALVELRAHGRASLTSADVKLSDAQRALARSYG